MYFKCKIHSIPLITSLWDWYFTSVLLRTKLSYTHLIVSALLLPAPPRRSPDGVVGTFVFVIVGVVVAGGGGAPPLFRFRACSVAPAAGSDKTCWIDVLGLDLDRLKGVSLQLTHFLDVYYNYILSCAETDDHWYGTISNFVLTSPKELSEFGWHPLGWSCWDQINLHCMRNVDKYTLE